MQREFVSGAGLGLRHALLEPFGTGDEVRVDFLGVASENWVGIGGCLGCRLHELTKRLPFLCHSPSLNLGGYAPLGMSLLCAIKGFTEQRGIRAYNEHLSAYADDGQLYNLMPLSFSDESMHRVAEQIGTVQDVLERPLVVENVSTCAHLPGELEEIDFARTVLEEVDCRLLLDVNNAHVDTYNFGLGAHAYIAVMPGRGITHLHTAGHDKQGTNLRIGIHGAPVCDPVWELLAHAYTCHGGRPTLPKRDLNLPPLNKLYAETDRIHELQRRGGEA